MIRVLHVLPRIGPGGAETMAVRLMLGLDRTRFEVAAVSLFDPSGTEQEAALAEGGVPVWYLGKRRGFDPRIFRRLAGVVFRFRPHVVHTHRHVLYYLLPLLLARGAPAAVHTVHTLPEREVGIAGRLAHRLAFLRGAVPVAIAAEISEGLRRVYASTGPLIPNGIPVETFSRSEAERVAWREREGFSAEDVLFVCVARLSPVKRHDLLLEAFSRCAAAFPRARLLLAGEGELRRDILRRAEGLGLRERVSLLGVRPDVADLLAASDAFVLASSWEGNPLSVMEAMAAGLPVVCTAVGGVPELVEDGISGLLVPPGEAESLAGAMGRLLGDRALRELMGRKAAAAAKRFDLGVMVRAYQDLYRSVLAAGGGDRPVEPEGARCA
ncbi:D-inositol-3-phosphate glycosyltransferase [Rubrobacter xylanophilus DSM 9941]|uniref:glycosyltransferase n=1 Tax=Rubrobacter xylanophilus TaxID=49319 RepID=UPI001C6423A1|nr:glycosyltransferase [Rubrobacter xylanophilus]QYJ15075.1 D-inositol-3-phosphate glycosyltransferase [Rubrobacter xylanophilus DSM 9941]